jgi:hypothetical protein
MVLRGTRGHWKGDGNRGLDFIYLNVAKDGMADIPQSLYEVMRK